jgi:amino acid adenylation domain-containing protein
MNSSPSRDKKVIAARKNIKEKEFWLRQLSGTPVISHFPFDKKEVYKRRTKADGGMKNSGFQWGEPLYSALMTRAKNSDHKLHVLLMSGVVLLLFKYTCGDGEKRDIAVTTPIYKPEVEGRFINTVLPLRGSIEGGMTGKHVLNQIGKTLIEAVNHQNYPIELLAEQLNMPFLFDAAVVLENIHDKDHIRPIAPKMAFSFIRRDNTLTGRVEYAPAFYSDLYVKEMVVHLQQVLEHVLSDPDRPVSSLEISAGKEPEQRHPLVQQKAVPFQPGEFDAQPGKPPKIKEKYTAPRDKIEETLAEIWADLLEKDKTSISINDGFFELDGQSLKAIMLSARIHKAFNVSISLPVIFEISTIKGLADYIKQTGKKKYASIQPVEEKDFYLLSPAQKRLYILKQMEPDSINYNVPQIFQLAREPCRERLEKAFQQLIRRHESLRTSFETIADEPMQRIRKTVEFNMEFDEVPYLTQEILEDFVRTFDLSRAPLLRVRIIKTRISNRRHVLLLDMHHIISDATTRKIFRQDFAALLEGQDLPVLRLQYKDYAQWLRRPAQQQAVKYQEEYWLSQFQGEIPVPDIPTDFVRPDVQRFEGDTVIFSIGKEETAALKKMARGQGTTMFMVWLAVYYVFLSKISGQEDIVVGTPVVGRRHADLERIVGIFVNTLALKNFPVWEKTFAAFLEEVKQRTLEASDNQEYPFEDLVDRVLVNRDMSRNPLFDLLFVFGDPGAQAQDSMEAKVLKKTNDHEYEYRIAKFDLILGGQEEAGRVILYLTYAEKLFKKETISRWINYIKKIAATVTEYPAIKISDILVISREEKKELLIEFNRTAAEYPVDKRIHQLFEEQVERTPGHTALIGQNSKSGIRNPKQEGTRGLAPLSDLASITYSELNERANQLAHVLREKGVQPDTIVGIIVERSIEMVIGILGILMAGGAYLPIEPETPLERIKYTLADSSAKVLLTTRSLTREGEKARRWEGEKIFLDVENRLAWSTFRNSPLERGAPKGRGVSKPAASLAYIIYTSGSTGKPKGVLVEHRSVVNIISALFKEYPLTRRDSYLLKTSYLFDVSVTELFGFFGEGGRLVVLEKDAEKDPQLILDRVEGACVTHINFVPSMFDIFTGSLNQRNIGKLSGVKYIFLAGEALQPGGVKKFKKLAPGVRLENLYGPTEGTVYATGYSLHHWSGGGVIPIGRPLQNVKVYIVDRCGHMEPVGIPGELLIGGVGAARGYLNNPELTFERFISYNRSHKSYKSYISKKLYKTGDLARWQPDGNIEFLGRLDHQVKIRGFRVEPAEIESQLVSHTKIKEAIVLSAGRAAGADEEIKFADKYLCAYLVAAEPAADMDIPGVREYLSRKLPYYMIPSYFIQIDRVPLTPGGKVDRKALPEPDYREGAANTYHMPRNSIEKKLAEIWASILLGKDASYTSIGIDDNFFEIGGHSLKATILLGKIHREFNVKILLKDVFKTPFIRGLAEIIVKTAKDKYIPIESTRARDTYPLSSAQKRLYFTQLLDEKNTRYNLLRVLLLIGTPDRNRLENTFRELIERHESLRTSFEVKEEVPVQRIHPSGEVQFGVELYTLGGELSEDQVINNFVRPFDLSTASLFRVGLIQTGARRYILMFDMHHIITDGISLGILTKEFMALSAGEPLPPLRLQYKDFSQWQNRLFESGGIKKQEEYWLNQFASEIPVLNLPTDFPRSSSRGFIGSMIAFKIEKGLTSGIKKLALDTRSTLFVVWLTVFNILLSKYTDREDIVVGTAVAGRRHPDLENIIGLFVNLLALRNLPEKDKSFLSFLNEVKENILNAFANQDYPFDELVTKLNLQGNPARNPLFGAAIQMQDVEIPELEIPGLKIQPHGWERGEIRFDLIIYVIDSNETIDVRISYSTTLFKKSFAEKMKKHLVEILEQGVTNREIKLKDIKLSTKLTTVAPVISKQDNLFGF